MAGLFRKFRTLILANLHDLADKAIQSNSIAVYDQYIRDAEQEIEQFKGTIRPIFAQVKSSGRRRKALQDEAAKLDLLVDMYLREGDKTRALVTQRKFVSVMKLVKTYDKTLERQIEAAESLKGILVKLEGRLDVAKIERDELKYLLDLAKAKEASTKAMKSLDSLVGAGDSDLATAAESIRSRLDHADAAWELETETLDAQLDSAMDDIELEGDLAERMERLGID